MSGVSRGSGGAGGSARTGVARGAIATGWTLGAWAAMQIARLVLIHNTIATLAVQAALAEWTAGKLAIPWSDPLAPPPSMADVRRRLGAGAAWGAGAGALVVGVAAATRHASIEVATPAVLSLVLGLAPATLSAVRDELLLRGMVSKIGRSLVGPLGAIALSGAAAAAVKLGAGDVTAVGIAVEGLRGIALAFVWSRDRGAWMAVGANAASTWVLDSVTRGDLLDVRMGAGEPLASVSALFVAATAAAVAGWWAWPGRATPTERRVA